MYTVQTTKNDDGTVNATATLDGFSFNSTIKTSEEGISQFVEEAKKQYAQYQEKHKDDDSLKSDIESLLNK